MQIGGLQKLTLIDFPDRVACTVFCLGCSFRCPWCYSKELVLPEEIEKQPKVSEKDFFDFLKKRKGLLEAVTICGGEPSINSDLPQFCKKIKKMGFEIKIDTNGSRPKMLKKLIDKKLVDYVAMDIKAPKEKYSELTGFKDCSNNLLLEKIEESINVLKGGKIDYEFRTTVVPAFLDKTDIFKIAQWLSPAKKYFLQNFRPEKTINPEFEKIKPYPDEFLFSCCQAVSPFFETCQIR